MLGLLAGEAGFLPTAFWPLFGAAFFVVFAFAIFC
jgi:hypothetical protein